MAFEGFDVEAQPERRADLEAFGVMRVPATIVGDRIVHGWNPQALGGKDILILSTHGGIRAENGTPIALGYHTGHWEVGLLMQAAAKELASHGAVPFGAYCTDPCDGRTQGTTGMY